MRTIFYNGIIYNQHYQAFNSMIINDKFIEAIGDNLPSFPNDILVDLKGKTILPSFLDAHSHITSVAMSFLQVDLSSCKTIKDIQDKLKAYYDENKPLVINGVNYDHNNLIERRHPTKDDIDKVCKDIPVVLSHNSNHFGVFNEEAIKRYNLNTLDGFLKETEFVNAIRKMPLPSLNEILNCYVKAQALYASYGITHVQEGMIVKEMLPIYTALLKSNLLYLDIYGYPSITEHEQIVHQLDNLNSYFHLPGYKVILDGSPQGKTAWMLTPYQGTNDYANGLVKDEDLKQYFKQCISEEKQLIAHCNGDHASLQFINVAKEFNNQDLKKIKPVIIHAQLLNLNQLDDVKKLHLIPSFFIAHIYHYGDIHIQNFGKQRASLISPAGSCLKKDIPFTFHQDSPVINPNMFETIQISLERLTKSNTLLGKDERIPLVKAMDAVTKNVAFQYSIDNLCGCLKEGNLANFIIIDKDIFNIPTSEIKELQILKTYKNGQCIYTKA